MKFFHRLFKKPEKLQKIQPDYNALVANYLQSLPRCSAQVQVLGARESQPFCNCEVTLAAQDLLRWAKHHAASGWHSDVDVQVATQALPIWLQNADVQSTEEITQLPALMQPLVVPYLDEFIFHYNLFRNGPVSVACLECNKGAQEAVREKVEAGWANGLLSSATQWACPQGHIIFRAEHEFHIQRRKRS
ncbi:hypothetical protein L1F30_11875 [Simiduia sp. 21SJ11W-1]|uniref:hypothetical protein n=1 Tax=Simiduia sp. 21SJ11W-1 TaxID=2909669 RepID=UPI0020A13BDF|nr:hypothetical protein [Simiduia sp. 21SJ11W-1]UTA46859.1 hypothetical protein L1F30_11875 [Simiduia sp. 21SJ11W-1]